ncbi:MAG TPA: sporulation histidine kinase inhibitor Sda [Pseudobacillus sp.]
MASVIVLLSDKQLMKIYEQAKAQDLSIDFILLLENEINRRKLFVLVC